MTKIEFERRLGLLERLADANRKLIGGVFASVICGTTVAVLTRALHP